MSTESPAATEPSRLQGRPGFALALTLGAIVIIGTMIAGAFYLSTQQGRAGRANAVQEQAFRVAEAGMSQKITNWVNQNALTLVPGQISAVESVTVVGVPQSQRPAVTVTRVNNDLFLVTSSATVGSNTGSETTRRVSQLVRMVGPTFNVLGALTVRGATQIGGASLINGNDQNPTGWTSCPATGAAKAGIAIGDDALISTSGCSGYTCVQGSPKISENPLANSDDTYFKYGDYTWDKLVALASKTLAGNIKPEPTLTAAGACNSTAATNWGDPRRLVPAGACEGYFPIIYYPGDAKLQGGYGQGILLVGGDLEVSGGFEFYGPVIVKGRLKTTGTGGHFNGAVMAANVELDQNVVLGSAIVNYSSCAIATAMQNAGRAMPINQRAWAEIF